MYFSRQQRCPKRPVYVFVTASLRSFQPGSLSSLRRHFLFKHGSGSSAIFSAASQNYPLTSNTVYSPPPRPLPRSTFSRPAFSFHKPYRCCNWKCTALSATAITVTLALLLAYVIGKKRCVLVPPCLCGVWRLSGAWRRLAGQGGQPDFSLCRMCCTHGWGSQEDEEPPRGTLQRAGPQSLLLQRGSLLSTGI